MQDQANTTPQIEQKPNDKELNFRALEQKYQRALEQERNGRLQAEQEAQRLAQQNQRPQQNDDEEDSEPYVDKKKLNRTLQRFGEQSKQETENQIQKAVHVAIQEERKQGWLKNNPDFYDVLQHAEKFAQQDPELAETILTMPEGFERQKLVYKNIKALGIHKPVVAAPSIQDKIDSNRRGPYYQPSNVGSAPHAGQHSDFSEKGKKDAYQKMQDLKKRLNLG